MVSSDQELASCSSGSTLFSFLPLASASLYPPISGASDWTQKRGGLLAVLHSEGVASCRQKRGGLLAMPHTKGGGFLYTEEGWPPGRAAH